jgi:hypothetical protein
MEIKATELRNILAIPAITYILFNHVTVSIYLSIYLSMALQPFVGPWQIFQFLDPIHSR